MHAEYCSIVKDILYGAHAAAKLRTHLVDEAKCVVLKGRSLGAPGDTGTYCEPVDVRKMQHPFNCKKHTVKSIAECCPL